MYVFVSRFSFPKWFSEKPVFCFYKKNTYIPFAPNSLNRSRGSHWNYIKMQKRRENESLLNKCSMVLNVYQVNELYFETMELWHM
jgi:hypothetical protein